MSSCGTWSRPTHRKQLLSWCPGRPLGINAAGGKNPPTSSREGVARMWAFAVLRAVQKMEERDVTLETTSGMPQGLHLSYEDDFLQCRSSQVPKVFSDSKFLPSIANSVYDLAIPSRREETAPFCAAPKKSASPDDPAGSLGGTNTPKTSLPPSPVGEMDDSNTDSNAINATIELDQSQSQESSRSGLAIHLVGQRRVLHP